MLVGIMTAAVDGIKCAFSIIRNNEKNIQI